MDLIYDADSFVELKEKINKLCDGTVCKDDNVMQGLIADECMKLMISELRNFLDETKDKKKEMILQWVDFKSV